MIIFFINLLTCYFMSPLCEGFLSFLLIIPRVSLHFTRSYSLSSSARIFFIENAGTLWRHCSWSDWWLRLEEMIFLSPRRGRYIVATGEADRRNPWKQNVRYNLSPRQGNDTILNLLTHYLMSPLCEGFLSFLFQLYANFISAKLNSVPWYYFLSFSGFDHTVN